MQPNFPDDADASSNAASQFDQLFSEGRYEEADRVYMPGEASLEKASELAQLYRSHLQASVAAGITEQNKPQLEALFRRAKHWAHCAYPAPQTAYEADDYHRGRAQDTQALIRILGYEPPRP